MRQLCLEPRCPDPPSYRGRCRVHSRQRNRETSPNRSVYNRAKWQNTRKRVLFEQPLCEHEGCEEIATDVHHIQAIQGGGDVWSQANLEALCHGCHSRETRREQLEATP